MKYQRVDSIALKQIPTNGQPSLFLVVRLNGQVNLINIDALVEQLFQNVERFNKIIERLEITDNRFSSMEGLESNFRPSRFTNLSQLINPPFIAAVVSTASPIDRLDLYLTESPTYVSDKYSHRIYTAMERII